MFRRPPSSILVSAFLLPALLACARPPSVPEDTVATLEREVPELLAASGVTGLSIALVRDGETLWTGAFGVRDAESGEPVTTGTVFQAASLSKPAFAYAVLRLAERGVLDLDAPLARYLPYERLEHDPRYRRITARHVLRHTSGLPNWGGTPLHMAFAPGERFSYSGEGFVYLQKVAEELTGLSLDEIARREVFEPLGMESSSFVRPPELAERAAEGHDRRGRPEPVIGEVEANAAGSLLTTASDYARFLAALADGEGLSDDSWRRMLTPQVEVEDRGPDRPAVNLHWGLGVGLQHGRAGEALFHWGDNPGFKAYFVAYPDSRSALVYFANHDGGLSIVEPIVRAFAEDSHEAIPWLGYERYDAPERRARMALEQAFLEGAEAGAERVRALREAHPEMALEPILNRVGYDLLGAEETAAAIAAFRRNAELFPDSANVHDSLGEGYTAAGRGEEAIASYRRSLELDPENENARNFIRWLDEGAAARESASELTDAELERYAGSYGPFQLSVEDRRLTARIQTLERGYPLVPLGDHTFELEGFGLLRLRFVVDEDGRAVRIVGSHANGRQRQADRDR